MSVSITYSYPLPSPPPPHNPRSFTGEGGGGGKGGGAVKLTWTSSPFILQVGQTGEYVHHFVIPSPLAPPPPPQHTHTPAVSREGGEGGGKRWRAVIDAAIFANLRSAVYFTGGSDRSVGPSLSHTLSPTPVSRLRSPWSSGVGGG